MHVFLQAVWEANGNRALHERRALDRHLLILEQHRARDLPDQDVPQNELRHIIIALFHVFQVAVGAPVSIALSARLPAVSQLGVPWVGEVNDLSLRKLCACVKEAEQVEIHRAGPGGYRRCGEVLHVEFVLENRCHLHDRALLRVQRLDQADGAADHGCVRPVRDADCLEIVTFELEIATLDFDILISYQLVQGFDHIPHTASSQFVDVRRECWWYPRTLR